jgi:hypothetical protein
VINVETKGMRAISKEFNAKVEAPSMVGIWELSYFKGRHIYDNIFTC